MWLLHVVVAAAVTSAQLPCLLLLAVLRARSLRLCGACGHPNIRIRNWLGMKLLFLAILGHNIDVRRLARRPAHHKAVAAGSIPYLRRTVHIKSLADVLKSSFALCSTPSNLDREAYTQRAAAQIQLQFTYLHADINNAFQRILRWFR